MTSGFGDELPERHRDLGKGNAAPGPGSEDRDELPVEGEVAGPGDQSAAARGQATLDASDPEATGKCGAICGALGFTPTPYQEDVIRAFDEGRKVVIPFGRRPYAQTCTDRLRILRQILGSKFGGWWNDPTC